MRGGAKAVAVVGWLLAWCVVVASLGDSTARAQPRDWEQTLGVRSGVCVVLGGVLGVTRNRAIEIARDTDLTVLVQYHTSPNAAEILRRELAKVGLLNTRVYATYGKPDQLQLADNVADAVYVLDERQLPPRSEAFRVLRPGGRLVVAGREAVIKPTPAGSGEWTHPYHGADNNPQAEDTLARAPYLTQFLATPWYGPMPEITLSSGGRLFKVFGHLAFKQREWPMLGKLICLNAYNGAMLWQRDLSPGFMVHRNTLVATPDTLYLGDNDSCKLIDAASGKLIREIKVPTKQAEDDGPAWKWMTVRDGVLYALVGEREKIHPVHRGTRKVTGWPWTTVRSTYGPYQETWGYGHTVIAVEVKSGKLLWSHRETNKVDSRATCMNRDRLFLYSHPKSLTALSIRDGKPAWKTSDPQLLAAIGEHDRAQNPRLGYSTSAYLKCNDDALYFAGPQRRKLVAVSARDGKLLWQADDGNVQLVLRDDGLYAMGRMHSSKKFEYLTGKVLARLECFRGNCTRATGAADSIFARGYRHSGTLRYDIGYQTPRRLPAMRPACQDGVVVANGLLYWGPWMCDCNHSLVGVISLGNAGDFSFASEATNAERLRTRDETQPPPVEVTDRDWPTYRANNQRTAISRATVGNRITKRWEVKLSAGAVGGPVAATAPVAVGQTAYVAGTDGAVMAVDTATGKTRWTSYPGAAIYYPPSFSDDRMFVGTADGWIHALHPENGKTLWSFRAAPKPRTIPVYGRLSSTWPVASGVLVDDGVAYAAAGIVSHDGTHVVALDAGTGKIKWQNNTSGNLAGEKEVVGVSVQGHLLLNDDKLYMAGGNVASPAVYRTSDGRCLNQLPKPATGSNSLDEHWKMQRSSRGSELYLAEGKVVVGGRMLYAPNVDGPASRYNANYLLQASDQGFVVQGNNQVLMRIDPRRGPNGKAKILWQHKALSRTDALAVADDVVLVAGLSQPTEKMPAAPVLRAYNKADGKQVVDFSLPAAARSWGIAIARDGTVLLSLVDGRLIGLGR